MAVTDVRTPTQPPAGSAAEFNVATYFIDRNIAEGRGANIAIECGEQRVTYAEVLDRVNRFGSALRSEFDMRMEERIVLLMLDCPEYAYAFFGAIKMGAVPIPTSTLFKPESYEYILNDSRARAIVISAALLPQLEAIDRARLPYLRHVIVVGGGHAESSIDFDELLTRGSPELTAAATTPDDAAFWLYSSGSTGEPKGCVHMHRDMVICAELYARGVLDIRESDR